MNDDNTPPGKAESEGRFSSAYHLCPRPEYWTSTDDHSTEVEVSDMIGGLVRGLQPDYVVETGSAWGQTSAVIGKALLKNKHGYLDSIEPDPVRVAYATERCVQALGHPAKTMPVRFNEISSMEFTPKEEIQFAFFDSLFPLRVPEFFRYRPYMRLGTIVAFHDTKQGHGGGQFKDYNMDLKSTIETELKDYIRFIHMPTPRGISIGEVL